MTRQHGRDERAGQAGIFGEAGLGELLGAADAGALDEDRGGRADARLEMAAQRIDAGLALLAAGDHAGYQEHCVRTKSDARDVGPVLRELLGPCRWRVHDLVTDDMSGPYQATPPTWVAGALVEFTRDPARAGGEDRR